MHELNTKDCLSLVSTLVTIIYSFFYVPSPQYQISLSSVVLLKRRLFLTIIFFQSSILARPCLISPSPSLCFMVSWLSMVSWFQLTKLKDKSHGVFFLEEKWNHEQEAEGQMASGQTLIGTNSWDPTAQRVNKRTTDQSYGRSYKRLNWVFGEQNVANLRNGEMCQE